MHRYAFPPCPHTEGPVSPPAEYFTEQIPAKCSGCDALFEGSCIRIDPFDDLMERFMPMDHGPCPIPGETSPVEHTSEDGDVELIPTKCASCAHLSSEPNVYGHGPRYCTLVMEGWNQGRGTLDWGGWIPDHLIPSAVMDTPHFDLVEAVRSGHFPSFYRASRRRFGNIPQTRALFDAWRDLNARWRTEHERALNERT